jgi:DNA-binding HxlR family transcriptional regulator/putative sterol carrier protein
MGGGCIRSRQENQVLAQLNQFLYNMSMRTYGQYCALARALDVVGDRWTLLIVRELMFGQRRFADLLDGLPGISRNLLTERLRSLEADGIIVREALPPPAARQVYELTGDGRDLADAVVPLVAWGARRLGTRKPGESFRPHWAALAMATFADREAARGVNETYQYLVGDTAFHFIVRDGSIQLRYGRAHSPAVTLTTDEDTWARMASGKTTGSAAAAAGTLTLTGDHQARTRLAKILSRSRVFAQVEGIIKDAQAGPRRSLSGLDFSRHGAARAPCMRRDEKPPG